jgi:hypothetical protein
MNRLKSSLTCSYCSKILKDPIELPCKHNLCDEHLFEKNVIKENRIKCIECKQDFEVKGNDFKTVDLVKKLLDELVYLSDEEFSLKKLLEDSFGKIFQMFEKFTLNKTKLDLDVHEHFQEIRFQLDEHRENLKQKIDDIYIEMIEKTKKFESLYLKSLEDNLNSSLKSFEAKSLEQSLKETEESFRNPNLLIDSIRDMQRQQEEAIAELKLKLDEQSQVKDNLKRMNEFKPNELFNQDSFGQLHLNEYSIIDPFESQILTDKQPFDLIKVCEFSSKDKWTLLYSGTRDGFAAANFHSKCDGHPNTLVLLKAHNSGYIFGGFSKISFDSSGGYKSDADAFLFGLTNKDNQPFKTKVTDVNSILCDSSCGPTFGAGHDLHICNLANKSEGSHSNLGHSYQHPKSNQGKSYLAGSHHFQLSEIEVYQKE